VLGFECYWSLVLLVLVGNAFGCIHGWMDGWINGWECMCFVGRVHSIIHCTHMILSVITWIKLPQVVSSSAEVDAVIAQNSMTIWMSFFSCS
jgi:hypothetical protein